MSKLIAEYSEFLYRMFMEKENDPKHFTSDYERSLDFLPLKPVINGEIMNFEDIDFRLMVKFDMMKNFFEPYGFREISADDMENINPAYVFEGITPKRFLAKGDYLLIMSQSALIIPHKNVSVLFDEIGLIVLRNNKVIKRYREPNLRECNYAKLCSTYLEV